MRLFGLAVACLLAALLSSPALATGDDKPVHVVRFSDYDHGPIDDWLAKKGFQFKQDADRRDLIDFDVGETGLVIDAKRHAFGFMPNESVNVPEFSRIEIDWGVNTFPKGASYEQGVRNEALMVIVLMGDERQSSGSFLIPNSPYFVGLFLCHGDDKVNYPYVGAYFKKGGRYVCLGRPEKGETITTSFDLLEAYREYFDKERDDDPAISGLALALDTKKAGDSGASSAFVREIRFYR